MIAGARSRTSPLAMAIRVYIVEDHQVMREALTDFIDASEGLEVCGSAASAEEALPDLFERDPAVAILDPSLPGRSGLELLEAIRAASAVPCLILSGHSERGTHRPRDRSGRERLPTEG